MDVPHYFTADQVQRLLDALAAHRRHQARTAALIMWRTGLRVSEVLELEWRDLDYSGDPGTLLVRRSKSRRARTVRLHPELVQLFTNWPANRTPRDKVVAISMRTVLRHIGDGIEWAGLDEESPGTGKRRAGAHSLRHSAARHWLMVGKVPLNVVSAWLGHANVQITLRIYLTSMPTTGMFPVSPTRVRSAAMRSGCNAGPGRSGTSFMVPSVEFPPSGHPRTA